MKVIQLIYLIFVLKISAFEVFLQNFDDIDCDLLEKLIEKYFFNCRKVLLIGPSHLETCAPLSVPVETYSEFERVAYRAPKGVTEHEKLVGLITQSSDSSDANETAQAIYKINPHLRTLLLTNWANDEIKLFLEHTWNVHQILDILILKSLTLLVAYNPFSVSQDDKFLEITLDHVENVHAGMETVQIFMKNRLTNLNQYPIRVSIFEETSICKLLADNGTHKQYIYQDGEIMHLLSTVINFFPNYTTNPDGLEFGSHLPNHSFTGALQDLQSGAAEIAANARIITNLHDADFFIYLHWCSSLALNFVTPARFYTYNFDVFPHSFYDKWVLSFYTITFILIVAMYQFINYFHFNQLSSDDEIRYSFVRNLFDFISLLMNIQLPIFPTSKNVKKCILLGAFLILTLNINSSYQGGIITQLNAKQESGEIDTLEDLLSTGLTFYGETSLLEFLEPFKDFENSSVYKRIYDRPRVQIDSYKSLANLTAENRTITFLTPAVYIQKFQADTFTNGEVQIHKVQETPLHFHLALTVPKGSPYIDRFNEVIDRIVAAGIVAYETKKGMYEAELEYIGKIRQHGVKNKELEIITMKELKYLFYFLAWMCLVSGIVLILEIVMHILSKNYGFIRQFETFLESNTI